MVEVDGQVEGGPSLPLVVLCFQWTTRMYTNHRIGQNGHWQQFGTQPILISAPQLANRTCNAPTRFYRVGKKKSVKADLAIYSKVLDVSGQCMSISLILFIKLDFSSCANWDGFCKSSHIVCESGWHTQQIHVYGHNM